MWPTDCTMCVKRAKKANVVSSTQTWLGVGSVGIIRQVVSGERSCANFLEKMLRNWGLLTWYRKKKREQTNPRKHGNAFLSSLCNERYRHVHLIKPSTFCARWQKAQSRSSQAHGWHSEPAIWQCCFTKDGQLKRC